VCPPVVRIRPSLSRADIGDKFPEADAPVVVQLPVSGSYSSAVAKFCPPETRTLPLGINDATCPALFAESDPVAFQELLIGSNISALSK